MRAAAFSLAVALTLSISSLSRADDKPASMAAEPEPAALAAPAEVAELGRLRRQSIATRRALSIGVVSAGIISLIGGVVLVVPETENGAARVAGVNTLAFGGVNVVVGAIALAGIRSEEAEWEEDRAAERETKRGLQRHIMHALADERREEVSHGINLGLGIAYAGAAIATTFASQFGVEHPQRWLASGVSIGAQAIFLIAIDAIGTVDASSQYKSIEELAFSSLGISVGPTAATVSVTRPF